LLGPPCLPEGSTASMSEWTLPLSSFLSLSLSLSSSVIPVQSRIHPHLRPIRVCTRVSRSDKPRVFLRRIYVWMPKNTKCATASAESRVVSARALIHMKEPWTSRAPKRRSLLPTGVDSLPSGKRTESFLSKSEITAPGRTPFSVRNVCTGTESPFGKRNKRFEKDEMWYFCEKYKR